VGSTSKTRSKVDLDLSVPWTNDRAVDIYGPLKGTLVAPRREPDWVWLFPRIIDHDYRSYLGVRSLVAT
jgi:hypothetical protein